jgi:penicillin-binding protein 1A
MGEWFSRAIDEAQWFMDRHIHVFALLLAAVAVPLSVALLFPVALQAVTRPLDQTPALSGQPTTFTFLDADGKVIGRRGPVAGEVLKLDEMPAYLPVAFLAMEDRRFYSHHGVDLLGLARAAYADMRAHRIVAGGSSISQQTAKLLFDERARTMGRKLRELVNTAILEKTYSKPQILEIYLNRIYLGGGAYGVDTAARTYFGVSARHVSLAQAAMLAALTRAPSVFSPRRDLAVAQARAARVLKAMVAMGAIRSDQAAAAIAHPATVIARPVDTHTYFLDAAAEEAKKLAGNSGPGELIVHTTLRSDLQAATEHIATDAVTHLGKRLNFSQTAMVVIKPDGAVAAMVGGVSYARSVFNRVTQAHRQPGSSFKPFVYLAALEAGISPWDTRDDQAVNIAGYQPANYNDVHYGRLRLIDALARSVNTITVNLAQEVGIPKVAAAAHQAGITSRLENNASLALGTNEVTPLELTSAYATLSRGVRVTPYLVSRIETKDGKLVYARDSAPGEPTIADTVRRDLTAMLYRVVTAGTGTAARLVDHEAAGKTGTTQDYRDAWFIGFTNDYVAGIWVGNDDNAPMRKVTGGVVPAPLWKAVMTVAEAGMTSVPLDRTPEPSGIGEAYADEQVSYVDDQNGAAPLLPVDGKGDFDAGSGVSSARVARSDDYVPAPVSPSYPAPIVSVPLRQQADPPPRDMEQSVPRPQDQPSYPREAAARPPDGAPFYSVPPSPAYPPRPPDGSTPVREAAAPDYPPRQADAPRYYQPWPMRPMPYGRYLEQREEPRATDPPPVYAQRYYYPPPPYEGPRTPPDTFTSR